MEAGRDCGRNLVVCKMIFERYGAAYHNEGSLSHWAVVCFALARCRTAPNTRLDFRLWRRHFVRSIWQQARSRRPFRARGSCERFSSWRVRMAPGYTGAARRLPSHVTRFFDQLLPSFNLTFRFLTRSKVCFPAPKPLVVSLRRARFQAGPATRARSRVWPMGRNV